MSDPCRGRRCPGRSGVRRRVVTSSTVSRVTRSTSMASSVAAPSSTSRHRSRRRFRCRASYLRALYGLAQEGICLVQLPEELGVSRLLVVRMKALREQPVRDGSCPGRHSDSPAAVRSSRRCRCPPYAPRRRGSRRGQGESCHDGNDGHTETDPGDPEIPISAERGARDSAEAACARRAAPAPGIFLGFATGRV